MCGTDKNEAGGAEYFETYVGPITSLYSQVWWTGLPSVDLPKDIVERFEGKGMAIVGYEVDQVRRKGDPDVDGSILQEDVSLPINVGYNHHHDAMFTGKHSHMEKRPYDPLDPNISPMARANPHLEDVIVEHSPSPLGLPTGAHLAAGNGGEYRKVSNPPLVQLFADRDRPLPTQLGTQLGQTLTRLEALPRRATTASPRLRRT
eukprot:COSAG04_NODE_486_length_13532_cov_5.975359_2_plen_204_part_00